MNKLQNEKSPYLLQHLDNPVDWYPWNEEAFSRARTENRLIFLSVGYSTCHWCHVMAHESFEDQGVAKFLNQDYVSIKVDREERPDIDQVYMDVCHRLTGSGGWPLTIIMTPEGHPFYAATYLPRTGRHGRPGMLELLPWIARKWQEEPDFLENSAREVISLLQRRTHTPGSKLPGDAAYVSAVNALRASFDQHYGGFARAPKFPRPHDLVFLLGQYTETGAGECLSMVQKTLLRMRCGGIYDQLGFGFHRYSTDEQWLLPHFEKMLYDQAGLIHAYLAAWRVTGEPFYAATVKETIAYLLRDMRSDVGAFFSAEDADSEGEEGKFYVWSHNEIETALKDDTEKFCRAYNATRSGNFHDEASGRLTGNNILHLSTESTSAALKIIADFSSERETLLKVRCERVRPHLDDKIITAWNGMALSALAESARLLDIEEYRVISERLAFFLLDSMLTKGRLLRRYREGEAAINGFAEDYAWLVKGLLDIYNLTFESSYLLAAASVAENLRELFQDHETGRLYDTAIDAEELLVRPSSAFDGAAPAASSVALEVFARLYLLSGDLSWRDAAESLLRSLHAELERYPAGYTALLNAARWLLKPTRQVVVSGSASDPGTDALLAVVRKSDLSRSSVLFCSAEADQELLEFAPFLRKMCSTDEMPLAYLCNHFACQAPVSQPRILEEILASQSE